MFLEGETEIVIYKNSLKAIFQNLIKKHMLYYKCLLICKFHKKVYPDSTNKKALRQNLFYLFFLQLKYI